MQWRFSAMVSSASDSNVHTNMAITDASAPNVPPVSQEGPVRVGQTVMRAPNGAVRGPSTTDGVGA